MENNTRIELENRIDWIKKEIATPPVYAYETFKIDLDKFKYDVKQAMDKRNIKQKYPLLLPN